MNKSFTIWVKNAKWATAFHDLRWADLGDADLDGADLDGADLSSSDWADLS
jgi:uncharacterized protein YjbI with pentapeptide repeats